jgi:glycolate oxidase
VKGVGVAAIEIINDRSIQVIKSRNPDLEVPDGEAHMLMIEFEGPERFDQIARVERIVREQGYDLAENPVTVEGEAGAHLWKLRKALLPTVRNYLPGYKALSLVNDVGVEEEHLADFIRDVEAVFDRYHLIAAIYGHAGSGNLHLRPLFDMSDRHLPRLLQRVADDIYEVVFRYDGTITAEHGMGRLRTPYLKGEWGETIVGYMRRVKNIFDPEDRLNPDVMFSDRKLTDDLDI